MRVFSSAPIIKRYDVFTLETADGITVIIKGFINKLRTNENGFPSEVGRFLLLSISFRKNNIYQQNLIQGHFLN